MNGNPPGTASAQPTPWFRHFARVLLLGSIGLLCSGQQFPLGQIRDFTVPEYHPAPNETRMKSLLQGAEALPQEGGRILVRQLKLQTFDVKGNGEFVMMADDCLYDPDKREASSPGSLRMMTADGRFSTEGEGFLWHDRDSRLIISNRVHTVIQSGSAAPPAS